MRREVRVRAMERHRRDGRRLSQGWPAVRALAALSVLGVVAAACGLDAAALIDFPGTTRQQLVAERVNPAVVVIDNQYKATVSLPTLGFKDANIEGWASQVLDKVSRGEINADLKTYLDTFVKGIAGNADTFYVAGQPTQTKPVEADFQCSGSIVTPDGY